MSNSRQIKTAIYGELARIGKALSSGPRLELLDLLSQRPCTVEELAELASLSVANTSRHLQVLKRARLVAQKRRGTFVEYRLADDEVAEILVSFRGLGRSRLLELTALERELGVRGPKLEALDIEALLSRMRSGKTTLLDVRPAPEFEAAHIRGAQSIPLDELPDRLHDLPRDQQVIAYCRGPFCLMAHEAVSLLREQGFDVEVYPEGLADWRARGLPVSTPSEESSQ